MTDVNKVSYRTSDYMLSSVQDFRKGEKGYQHHIWQATLSPYAVVFSNNPDSLRLTISTAPATGWETAASRGRGSLKMY